jgi:hypothetical protein
MLCVLRIAYCVLRITYWQPGTQSTLRGITYCVLRIAYCVEAPVEGHYVLRITYYVLRIGALRGVAYRVLRMRITYWGFEGHYVLRITYYVLRIGALRGVAYCVLRITYYVLEEMGHSIRVRM